MSPTDPYCASRAALLLATSWLAGCGSGATTDGAASATPSASTSAWVVESTDVPGKPFTIPPEGSAIVHQAGTVPTAVASALAKQEEEKPVEPKIERLPAQPSSRKGPSGLTTAGWIDDSHVALHSPGRLEIVALPAGTSVVLTTGARIVATDGTASRLVTADASNRVVLWDLTEKSPPRSWAVPAKTKTWDEGAQIALSADGAWVAHGRSDLLEVWDAGTGKEKLGIAREVPTFQLVVTRNEVFASSNNSAIEAFRLDDGKPAATAGFQTGGTFGITVSPDGRWAAGGAPDGHGLQVSDMRQNGAVRQLVESTDCQHHVGPAFSRDSRHVYAVLGQDWIKGFDTDTWKPYASYRAEGGRTIATFADDLSRVVVVKEGLEPKVVVVATKKETPLERPFDATGSYEMNADGSLVLATDEKHEVRVWSTKTAKVVYEVTPS